MSATIARTGHARLETERSNVQALQKACNLLVSENRAYHTWRPDVEGIYIEAKRRLHDGNPHSASEAKDACVNALASDLALNLPKQRTRSRAERTRFEITAGLRKCLGNAPVVDYEPATIAREIGELARRSPEKVDGFALRMLGSIMNGFDTLAAKTALEESEAIAGNRKVTMTRKFIEDVLVATGIFRTIEERASFSPLDMGRMVAAKDVRVALYARPGADFVKATEDEIISRWAEVLADWKSKKS